MEKLDFEFIDSQVSQSEILLSNLTLELVNNPGENYYRFLYHFVRRRKPKLCVEIGVHSGIASYHMLMHAQFWGGIVIGIDFLSHKNPEILSKIYPVDYVYLNKNSLDTKKDLEYWTRKQGKIDLVFQDSSHHYDESCQEWNLFQPFLNDNFLWLCDDITESFKTQKEDKGMVDYFNERPGRKKLYPDVLHHGNTMGIILNG